MGSHGEDCGPQTKFFATLEGRLAFLDCHGGVHNPPTSALPRRVTGATPSVEIQLADRRAFRNHALARGSPHWPPHKLRLATTIVA